MINNFIKRNIKIHKVEGFTLAEVLVTFVIIGIVSALVIPAIITTTNKIKYVVKLKKAHSVLSQAFNLIVMDAGGSILNNSNFNSASGGAVASANSMNDFATKLNVIKNCGSSTGCLYTSSLKWLGGTTWRANLDSDWNGSYGKAILADGSMMMVSIYNSNCTSGAAGSPLYQSICGYIYIDINGAATPNEFGRDFFAFWITKIGIYPIGILNDGYGCVLNTTGTATNSGCAGKVITQGDMNY
ncbi:MAG: hypothetical protein ACD_20C00042G0008 [uncultured bacterium]|nr:MAG: hypothetical protein ACD_20C00042G0008 [uncultured bacterium]